MHTLTRTHLHAHTHTHALTHTHTHLHTRMHAHTYTHTHTHVHMHAHTYTHTHALTHTHVAACIIDTTSAPCRETSWQEPASLKTTQNNNPTPNNNKKAGLQRQHPTTTTQGWSPKLIVQETSAITVPPLSDKTTVHSIQILGGLSSRLFYSYQDPRRSTLG